MDRDIGGVSAQRVHGVHMTGRNRGFLLQLAIFLPNQTILHPHNVGHAFPSFLVHWCVLFASFPVGSGYLSRLWIWIGPFPVGDMDWPLWRAV